MLTFADYLGFVEVFKQNHPEQREGQAHANALHLLAPVNHMIADTSDRDLNPFNHDDRLSAFLEYVERWF